MSEIMEKLQEWTNALKDFVMGNHTNPFLWVGIILVALAIFGVVYSALHKD